MQLLLPRSRPLLQPQPRGRLTARRQVRRAQQARVQRMAGRQTWKWTLRSSPQQVQQAQGAQQQGRIWSLKRGSSLGGGLTAGARTLAGMATGARRSGAAAALLIAAAGVTAVAHLGEAAGARSAAAAAHRKSGAGAEIAAAAGSGAGSGGDCRHWRWKDAAALHLCCHLLEQSCT